MPIRTQRSGAVAEGYTRFLCSVSDQQWELEAEAQGRPALEPGPALAVALAASHVPGGPDDAHQRLVPITLVGD